MGAPTLRESACDMLAIWLCVANAFDEGVRSIRPGVGGPLVEGVTVLLSRVIVGDSSGLESIGSGLGIACRRANTVSRGVDLSVEGPGAMSSGLTWTWRFWRSRWLSMLLVFFLVSLVLMRV